MGRRQEGRSPAPAAGRGARGTWPDRLLLTGAMLVAFCSALHSLIDPDVWFHLAAGRWTLAHGIPRADTFSFPSAGRPYVDLHWLFQLLALGVYRLAREPGLILLSGAVITGTFALVYARSRRVAGAALAATLTATGAVMAGERMSPRPEILSFLFLALMGWLVVRHREGWKHATWGMPLVMLLWVNSEGLFILGFLILGAALLDTPRDRPLWRAGGLCVAAAFCNPWFAEGAIHPFVLFSRVNRSLPIYSQTIGEFRSPFQDEALYPSAWLFRYIYLPLLPLLVLTIGKRIRRGEILLVAATTYLAWSARRNIALLPIVTIPIFARWIAEGWLTARIGSALRRALAPARVRLLAHVSLGLAGLAMLVYLQALATNRLYAHEETNRRFGLSPAPVAFAREAARFVTREGISGPIFTTFPTGSFFTWAVPQEKVFIDGRLEVHSAEHYERYLRLIQGGPAWQQADQQFQFNAAVIQYMDAMNLALERLRDPAWAPVHLDDTAIVFVRRNDRNAALIEKHGLSLPRLRETYPTMDAAAIQAGIALPGAPSPIARALSVVRFPWSRLHLGQFFLGLNRPDFAVPQLIEGVKAAPGVPALRIMLAMALNGMGQPAAALPVIESAAALGGSRGAQARLWIGRGDILDQLGRSSEAIAAYDRCVRLLPDEKDRPQLGAVLASRAHARLKAGDLDRASSDLAESLRILPTNGQAYFDLGQVEEARGRREAALDAYRRAAGLGMQTPEVEAAFRRLGASRP